MQPLPWRSVLLWALVGTLLGVGLAVMNLVSTRDQLGGLVVTSPKLPAASVIGPDLGDDAVKASGAHDGAFFYLLARQPMHLDRVAPSLDRPRYRSQRILFPVLGWALHPSGGGPGLVWALFAVGVAGVAAGAVAMGARCRRACAARLGWACSSRC